MNRSKTTHPSDKIRFERDLSRLAFTDAYAITFPETAERLLAAAATIVAGEDMDEEKAVDLFRSSIAQARAFNAAIDELGDFAEMVMERGVGEA